MPQRSKRTVRVNEPVQKCLPIDDGGAGLIENIESTWVVAAVAGGSRAVAVAVRVARALLLRMVVVRAQARVCAVALFRVPRTFGFELYPPRGVGGVVQDFANFCIPRVPIHAVSVCAEDGGSVRVREHTPATRAPSLSPRTNPARGARRCRGGELHLLKQQLLIVHGLVLGPAVGSAAALVIAPAVAMGKRGVSSESGVRVDTGEKEAHQSQSVMAQCATVSGSVRPV